MKKLNKYSVLTIGIALFLIIAISSSVYAASNSARKTKGYKNKEAISENVKVGEIEVINERTLTIALGEIEKQTSDSESEETSTLPDSNIEDSEKPARPNLNESFVKGTEKITVTVPEDIDISNLKVGDVIFFEVNDNNEVTKIFTFGEKGNRGKEGISENAKIGEIEVIDGRTLTIALGEIEKPTRDSESEETSTLPNTDSENENRSTRSNFDLSELFVKGTEKITVTVPDNIDISNLKVGDIIRFEADDNNEVTKIFTFGDKSNKNTQGMKEDSNSNKDNSNMDTVTGATKTQSSQV